MTSGLPDNEIVIPCGDWNRHVGRVSAGYEGVHEGHSYGSLIKLHYFELAFLENSVHKKHKKSIKDQGIFFQTHFLKCSLTL